MPSCTYIIYAYACGHQSDIVHQNDCAACQRQLVRIYNGAETGLPFDWPARCAPLYGFNVFAQSTYRICPRCQEERWRWMGSTNYRL